MGDVTTRPIRIGISACLLGAEVRYDGGHKRDQFLSETFGRFVEWVPVCPEVEAGFGTPREPMRLVRVTREVRLLTVKTERDVTGQLDAYSTRRVSELASEDLSGYVLKKDSPSCGLERVKVYDAHSVAARSGQGRFASALVERFPDLPVEEEGRLSDPHLRENFVERVFAYWRLRGLFAGGTFLVGALHDEPFAAGRPGEELLQDRLRDLGVERRHRCDGEPVVEREPTTEDAEEVAGRRAHKRNLVAVRMLLADGRSVRAAEDENADLFWAVRGGVATSGS